MFSYLDAQLIDGPLRVAYVRKRYLDFCVQFSDSEVEYATMANTAWKNILERHFEHGFNMYFCKGQFRKVQKEICKLNKGEYKKTGRRIFQVKL